MCGRAFLFLAAMVPGDIKVVKDIKDLNDVKDLSGRNGGTWGRKEKSKN